MTNVPKTKRAWIIVLGDIGRSPRMQNHAQSLAQNGNLVELIGFVESKPNQEVLSDPRINIHKLTPFPDVQFPKFIKYIFKIIWSILSLLTVFVSIKRADLVMVQNPPGIPTLILCYFYCKIVKAEFIIDWHNYTWTIMALETSETSSIIRFAKSIEFFFGQKSHLNFCVTKAMKQDLHDNWNIEATVLYDRPPERFQPITIEKKHDLFQRLGELYPEFKALDDDSTAFTVKPEGADAKLRENRPGLLVSSTSYTPDEDFQILIDALTKYEQLASEDDVKYPQLICVITGKGPQKSMYQQKISEKRWKFVKIVTPWLEPEDYPLLLASADLGVCLHYSSSGLDLPMKVVDMFGCGLPVCAMNFKCLNELVHDGENGFIFNDANELSDQLGNWFYGYPGNVAVTATRENFTRNLKKFQALRWKDNWNDVVLPHIKK